VGAAGGSVSTEARFASAGAITASTSQSTFAVAAVDVAGLTTALWVVDVSSCALRRARQTAVAGRRVEEEDLRMSVFGPESIAKLQARRDIPDLASGS
jgi:hypothetical protein